MRRTVYTFVLLCLSIFSFSQTILKIDGYTEDDANLYFSKNYPLNHIEGIWKTSEGYTFVIEKNIENGSRQSNHFRLIVLEGYPNSVWNSGEIKGFIYLRNNVYFLKYYLKDIISGNPTGIYNTTIMFDSPKTATYIYDKTKEVSMQKLYPVNKVSVDTDEW